MDNVLQKIAEATAAKLTLTDDQQQVTYPFVGRWHSGFPDDDFIENTKIAAGQPWMSIYAGSQAYSRDWALVKNGSKKTVSAVTHVGNSTLTYALTGTHIGNNDYVLEIVIGGAPGTATYKLSKDGGTTFGEDATVPADGKVVIGDGTSLEFSGGGSFVATDTYSWKTESLIEQTYRTHIFKGTVNIEMLAFAETELNGDSQVGHTGYQDQILALFSEKGGVVIDTLSSVRTSIAGMPTVIKDERVDKFRGTLVLEIEGELYITKTVPMAGAVKMVFGDPYRLIAFLETIALWHFEESLEEETQGLDLTGNNIDSTDYAQGISEHSQTALDIEGYQDDVTDEYGWLPANTPALDFGTSSFTVEIVCKPLATQEMLLQGLVGKKEHGYLDDVGWELHLRDANQNPALYIGDGQAGHGVDAYWGGTPLKDGTWYYLAVVVDMTNKQALLYIDGQPHAENPKSLHAQLGSVFNSSKKFYVGFHESSPDHSFTGLIDEVCITKRALTPAEIAARAYSG